MRAMLMSVVGFVAATFVVAGGVLLLLRAWARSVAFPGSNIRFLPEEELRHRYPKVRLVRYRTEDGLELTGAFLPAAESDALVLVYFHGNAESAAQNLDLAEELAYRGIATFLAEYRGYGGMPGRPSEEGLYADGEAALRAVLASGVEPERLVLAGRSLGSAVAVELATRHPCALLLLVSPFISGIEVGRRIVGPLAPLIAPGRFDSLTKIERLGAPIVILHGTRDEVIPFEMGRRLAAAAPRARFVPLKGRGHNDIPNLGELMAREIRRVLKPEEATRPQIPRPSASE